MLLQRTCRSAAALLAANILLSAAPALGASPPSFRDVSASTRYGTAIDALQSRGVIEGYADPSAGSLLRSRATDGQAGQARLFKPQSTINRAEFLKIVLRSQLQDFEESAETCFPDVQEEDWFAAYVCTAKAKGIVQGYPDGLFHPERDINFVESAKIITLAYDQPVHGSTTLTTGGGREWYEPFARALESSKAIPPTIGALDQHISRGEMVEMMWRLSEDRTDQPTKGYLNVKYPEVTVNLAADTPQQAQSCTDLRAFVAEAAVPGGFGYGRGDVMMLEEAESVGPTSPSTAKSMDLAADGADYAQTNVQVAGVDEADIVKTDGDYLYIVTGQKVRIVDALPVSAMNVRSTIDLEEVAFNPTDLYVDGNRLIVIGSRYVPYPGGEPPHIMEKRMMAPSIWPGPWYGNTQKAEVRIYDVTDRAKPALERKVALEGSTISTRKIGSRLYLIVHNPVHWIGPGPIPLNVTEKELLPTIEDSRNGEEPVARCGSVTILPHPVNPQYLTVAVIPVDRPDAEVQRTTILGNGEHVYASLENLYVANTQWNYEWDPTRSGASEETHIFRFAFTGDGVNIRAQGAVPGHLLNQFSMDEHGSVFRVATTINSRWIGPENRETPSTNNLYTLSMDLDRIGAIEDISPGETIYSVRFINDRAYMVTFQKIDPFFVLDLADAQNPRILGKLKIPGYSDYLHPYDENHIIGFGKEALEAKEGDFAWYQGMKVAVFDVTDVADPKELHKITIGDRGTESPLLHNHKALLFEKDRDLLAFPVSVAKIPENQKQGEPGSVYGTPVFQGAHVYTFDLTKGFTLRGTITHYDSDAFTKAGDRWYGADRDIQRITRIGSHLYTISNAEVQAHSEEEVKKEGEVVFK